ncbi:DUF302 domain-containing protein [Alisedimentitalea sp. MJ-SS2]|uniref:DUF302 domain-containing protein n=1 Tax=Aliisedimentitalea sp. MJ-SS2 TaxID=3049795 RepID=UPI002909B6BA|nr:DUF302 domain-containing protein [Alisedimentitalea sp. MJ-SS2]MDU8926628.1 DUF302 domain-containing protein [Alisedimentitalea sp. MJ-SS2]
MKRYFYAAFAAAFLAVPVHADDGAITYTTDESFDDVVFGLENAIVDAGLVVDSVSHTGDMLERTKGDVGSDVTIFKKADIYSFCSAAISRRVMEADPMNVVYCPYNIFVLQMPDSDEVTIGYRTYPDGPMQEVQALLDGISKVAIGIE